MLIKRIDSTNTYNPAILNAKINIGAIKNTTNIYNSVTHLYFADVSPSKRAMLKGTRRKIGIGYQIIMPINDKRYQYTLIRIALIIQLLTSYIEECMA